jgi:hypothetical protein
MHRTSSSSAVVDTRPLRCDLLAFPLSYRTDQLATTRSGTSYCGGGRSSVCQRDDTERERDEEDADGEEDKIKGLFCIYA